MKKIKVLHLSSERSWRGGEQQIAYLIGELASLDVENFVAVKSKSAFEAHCQKNSITHTSLPFRNSIDLETAWRIRKICDQYKIDLIHMHSSKSHSMGVLSAAFGNKTPLILSRRVDFVPGSGWFTRWKYNHPAIKKIICVSEKVNEVMKKYVTFPQKCVTVHSGIDISRSFHKPAENILKKDFGVPENYILIGNTSALEHHKDYFTFLDTISLLVLKKLPVMAFVIGRGSQELALRQYCKQKGLEKNVVFTGFRNDVGYVLPCLDIFLMTSQEEGLGTSILDAFQARVPVVATAAGGIPEMVIHSQTGLIAPIGDAALLAKHIETMINNPKLKDVLITGAHAKVKEFAKQKVATKTLAIYREVLQSQKRTVNLA